jgi:hypothetical protein
MMRQTSMVKWMISSMLVLIIVISVTFSNFYIVDARKHHHTTSNDNTINKGSFTDNVITSNTSIAKIPGEVEEDKDLTVGTMLFGCNSTVSRGNDASIQSKPHCDTVIGYLVNYCLANMNMSLARENKQVCWDTGAMEDGLQYAVSYLDGGTGRMIKAKNDIMATIANFNAGLSKEALISKCELATGIHLSPAGRNNLLKDTHESLEKICG